MNRTAVFLDIDGVLLDPRRTPLEWIRLMGDLLAPALGGARSDWGRANAAAFPALFADRACWYDDDPLVAERNLATRLFREECRIVGVPYPGDDAAFALGRRLDEYVCRRADCAFAATTGVIHELAASYELHTATGNPSWRVEALFEQWHVRHLFGVTSGTDLVGVMKDSTEFHPRVFDLAGVRAGDAIVVDDAPGHTARARAAGARTILVDPGAHDAADAADAADAVIGNIAELPGVLARMLRE